MSVNKEIEPNQAILTGTFLDNLFSSVYFPSISENLIDFSIVLLELHFIDCSFRSKSLMTCYLFFIKFQKEMLENAHQHDIYSCNLALKKMPFLKKRCTHFP